MAAPGSSSTPIAPIITQVGSGAPLPSGLDVVSAPLYPSSSLAWQMRSFPPETYDLRISSHVVRLASVLLGETAGELFAKRIAAFRLAEAMSGSSFLDLDNFWGVLFGLDRNATEVLPINPATGQPLDPSADLAPSTLWQEAHDADSGYRDRIFQFAQGINYGASLMGIQQVSEAVLGTPVEVFENFEFTNTPDYTQFPGESLNGQAPLYEVTIVPHTSVGLGDIYNLHTILNAIKPVYCVIYIRQIGVSAYLPVPIAQAWSPFSSWEIEQTVTPGPNSPYSQGQVIGRWPFSAATGHTWSLIGSVTSSSSAAWDTSGNMVATASFLHTVWPDGTFTNYTPDAALMDIWTSQAGRLSQVGTLSSNPLSTGTSTVSIDGIDLESYASLVQSLGPKVVQESDRYWGTPIRPGSDTTIDVATYLLDKDHLLTSVSFEVVRLPSEVSFEHLDATTGVWIRDYSQVVSPSSPLTLGSMTVDMANHVNPYFDFTDAWVPVTFALPQPVIIGSFRLVLTHLDTPNVPVDLYGAPVAYPLGVRSLNVGVVVTDLSAAPTSGQVIDTSTNIFGDHISYGLVESNPNGPIAASPTTWKSTPQLSASSVVPYYLDTRDATGAPQTIDALFVAPTHLGVTAALYWTQDQPSGGPAVNDPLSVTTVGSYTPTSAGLTLSSTAQTAITVPGSLLRFGEYDWWLGISWVPGTVSTYSLASFGTVTVSVASGVVSMVTPFGTLTVNVTLPPGIPVSLICASTSGQDASSGLLTADATSVGSWGAPGNLASPSIFLAVVSNGQVTSTLQRIASPLVPAAPSLILGDLAASPSGITLSQVVLKGEPLSADTVIGFGSAPGSYSFPGLLRGDDTSLAQNAWVRFDPLWITADDPTGFVGGVPDTTSTLNWIPLLGQWQMTTGHLRFNTVAATFIKMEFTNLVAEPISNPISGLSTTKLLAPSALTPSVPVVSSQGAVPPGVATQKALASGQPPFGNSTPAVQPVPPPGAVLSTTALVSSSPAQSQSLAASYYAFGYVDWHSAPPSATPFSAAGPDEYLTETIVSASQIGFFCGLRQVQAIRTNLSAALDTAVYTEHFWDDSHFGPINIG